MRWREDSKFLQLPGVTRKREQRLHDYGYIHLWDVAEADVEESAADLMIVRSLTQQMISTANYLVMIE